jgi:hypothetical protein
MRIEDLDSLIQWLTGEWQYACVVEAPNRERVRDALDVMRALRHSAVTGDEMFETNFAAALFTWRDVLEVTDYVG